MGRTNGYSRRASKDKQIFGLDLLLSEDIPGVQMTFPPVTLPAPLTAPPPKRKTPAGVPGMVESTKAFGMICMAVFSARGVQVHLGTGMLLWLVVVGLLHGMLKHWKVTKMV